MKAEERKALETNVLADELGKAIQGLKKGPSRSVLVYVGLAALLLLSFVLFRYFQRSSTASISERWVKVDGLIFSPQVDEFLKEADLKTSAQADAVAYRQARLKLTDGIRDLGNNLTEATKLILEATELYEKLVKSKVSAQSPLLHQEALWGAAKGKEALGEIEQAQEYYKTLVKEYPASAMGKDAARQLERMETPQGRKDLDELRKAFAAPQ